MQEVVVLAGKAVRAEFLRQGDETPEVIRGDEILSLASIGYAGPLVVFMPPAT